MLTVSKLLMYFGATLMFIELLVFLLQILSVLAVEVDMPWKNDLNEKYGESFRAWTEEDLSPAVRGVVGAFSHNQMATIVCFVLSTHIF